MEIIDRLNLLQKRSGMNQKDLTSLLGISSSAFTEWNKGKTKPGLKPLVKFSEHFNVSLDWLVFGDESENSKVKNISELFFTNPLEEELINKFRALPPEYRSTVIAYLDGMLATIPKNSSNKKLSV